jgi:hypothetical protein
MLGASNEASCEAHAITDAPSVTLLVARYDGALIQINISEEMVERD